MENQQPIGVAVGISEVVTLAGARHHAQVLLGIVDRRVDDYC
jgi:hypothetical protein